MEPVETETAVPAGVDEQPATAAPPAGPDLEDPALYFNRELSWLDFNDRVLQLAEDASVPLLERAKFAAIWESNLDEFFMVRVANLQDMLESGTQARAADGMSATELLAAIRTRVLGQRERAGRVSSASCGRSWPSTGSGSSPPSRPRTRNAPSSATCSSGRCSRS